MSFKLKSHKGFTLIEALVAFTILTICLGQLLKGVSGGVRNETRADFLLSASRQCASQIEALGIESELKSGETRGVYRDGLIWSLVVKPVRSVSSSPSGPIISTFYAQLEIKKPNGFGDSLHFSTIKIKIDQNRIIK